MASPPSEVFGTFGVVRSAPDRGRFVGRWPAKDLKPVAVKQSKKSTFKQITVVLSNSWIQLSLK
jgi:hypothetical protein